MRVLSSKILVVVAMLLASLLPASPAHAAVAIEFLNPSGYSSAMIVSDKPDADNTYHLVSWIKEVPTNPLVEFEVATAAGMSLRTIDGFPAGLDTWEGSLSLSGIPDGQYLFRARLYADFTGPGTGREVAVDEVTVTVRSATATPTAANTVEMIIPDNARAAGYFTPVGKPDHFLVDGITSQGTRQVRALYTTSAPGMAPEWNACGSGIPSADLRVRIRCTLAEGASGARVTALALVANDTLPPASPNPVADGSGDAHRVVPYLQRPQRVMLTPSAAQAEVSSCPVMVVSTMDQQGQPIALANIDIHVVGPDDQIQFGIIDRTTSPQASVTTGAFQAPDKAHPSSRPAHNCGNREAQGSQGDHNIPGANDPQHIESTTGTNNVGEFVFALRSTVAGSSDVQAWVDVDDDDALSVSEASGGAQIGWGQPPPPPSRSILIEPASTDATTGTCERFTVAAKEGGNPLPQANVDIHVFGPDESVGFCTPGEDASIGREPDQGGHVGNMDNADTRHLEGETDSQGRFVFGVTSRSEGTTTVTAWLDSTDDDVMGSDETARDAQVTWAVSGDRSLTISSNRSRVPRGRKVRISGVLQGSEPCVAMERVKLKARRMNGGRFRTIATTTTDPEGDYEFRVRVKRSKRYRTIAPRSGICDFARSKVITVRAK